MTPTPRIFPIEDLSKRKGLVACKCLTCHKEYAQYAVRLKKSKKTFCSRECWRRGSTLEKRYAAKMREGRGVTFVKRVLSQAGFYKNHKDEYKDKIVDYKDSPTGKAYVGINKSPFMPAADGGHGYQGVLIQDENREFIQCHSCGEWMQKITNRHLKRCSGIDTKKYKEKYGLNEDQGLVSDETSLRLTKACLKNTRPFAVQNRKGRHGRSKGHSMEFFNRYGTCPLQLKTRLYEFIRCNRELPSQGNRGRSLYKALRRRYGSFGHALSAHGLPWMKRQGTTMRFAFPDGTILKYNLNQFYDREGLFKMMMEKCPELRNSTPAA